MAPPDSMGERIRDARVGAGLSLLDLMVEVRARLPKALWVTHETLRRYENGSVTEEKADPVILAALADALGCRMSELSPIVANLILVLQVAAAAAVYLVLRHVSSSGPSGGIS